MEGSGNQVLEGIFGYLPSQSSESVGDVPIKRFTISNKNGMQVKIISYGAAITSIRVPDGTGKIVDVVLGFDDIKEYLRDYSGGYGSAVGRFANFIENGTFTLNGNTFNVGLNHRGHHLHGGAKGFHTKIWDGKVIEDTNKVAFFCESDDGEDGYPGTVLVRATYELTSDNQLVVNFEATCTKPTPINMTSHGHFNLGGHETAHQRLIDHVIQINADNYTVAGSNGIPNGLISSVDGTDFDFRVPQNLNKILEAFPPGVNGFNLNYCVNPSQDGKLNFVARITNTKTKIVMEILSNQPGVQFYTGQHWPDPDKDETPIAGKDGAKYMKYGFFALETQNYPNAVNIATFPNAIVNPGQIYHHTFSYKFSHL